jgi:hypothetical protein
VRSGIDARADYRAAAPPAPLGRAGPLPDLGGRQPFDDRRHDPEVPEWVAKAAFTVAVVLVGTPLFNTWKVPLL